MDDDAVLGQRRRPDLAADTAIRLLRPRSRCGAGAAVAAGAAVGADLGLPALGWENESGNESSPPQAATTASNSAANAGTAQTPHFITNTSVMRGPGAEIR